MKLLWNSLLISLGILLPTSTSMVLAKSVAVEEREPAKNPTTIVIPDITQESLREVIISDDSSETPETIVIPDTAPVSSPSTFTTEETDVPTAEESTEEIEASENAETAPEAGTEESVDAQTPELTPEELERQQTLIEADRLYMSGQFAAAQQLYRQAKAPFEVEEQVQEQSVAIYDPAELSPAGAVYWRQAQAGLEQQLETKILVPLQFLVEQQPEFIPAHLSYAQALKDYGREEEALEILERGSTLYPNEPELLKARITALGEAKRWLEASLAARQFALLNFNHPQAEEFEVLAEENLERHKSHLRSELRGNAIANVITGALGYIFTGNLFGPISAVETTVLMLRGESAVGEGIAKQVQRQLPMVEDEEVLEYVREIGNKLAIVTGRDEFEYEFYVIMDDRINAFALPGGKVFVNAGAILKTNSEAELAGLLAHELAHAVLSHGFQLVTEGNLIANITQYIPFGGTATNLIVLNYSRNMERQADDLGTRILVAGGYAADGLHNLMMTLAKEEQERPLFAWLSTHPDTEERISNLETLIERNGYNRYTYEGVARHLVIQERVAKLLKEYEERQECEEEEREDCEETPEQNESELSN
ncbi:MULTISPECIES: M48 family metalloprotease [unclassified Coleofasciculus]|uniref:M48 family metalloprotease n=2 Tax=unclassified Coleofasciculus TaxID=2692782 RepID=UPI0018800FBA|nr:M48 family metalloprotease [Coleofasciculus sp. LEGE 07081]MBE9148956.1 M48 family metalloprotease [Coleofasciculus sp. LEGE 07092]